MSGIWKWIVVSLTGAGIIIGAMIYFCLGNYCSWVFVPGVVPFTYQWESKGPFEMSGAIRHIMLDPANSHRLYAASENGGLWILDDDLHPETGWRPLSDKLENLQMRGIAKSSDNPNYIVTANAAGFVYHTKDHGATWSRITDQNFQYIRRLLIAEEWKRIQIGNHIRIWKETRIWVASQLGLFRILIIGDTVDRVDQLYPQTVTQLPNPDVLDVVRNPSNDDLYIGVRGQGVLKMPRLSATPADAWTLSANWTTYGDALSPMIRLAITPTGDRIVAKFGRNVIVNDVAGDPTGWTTTSPVEFGDTGGSDIGYRGNYSGSTGEWTHAIAISPTNNNVIVVGQGALFVSTTGGQPGPGGAAAWTLVQRPGHEDIQSLVFSPDGTSLFIANDGGVYRHPVPVPTANTFPTDLNVKLTTAQFYRVALNGSVAVANADHQGIRGTRDIEASSVQWELAPPSGHGFGGNSLENDFVTADPMTAGRFFVQFNAEHLLRLRYPTATASTQDLLPLNPTGAPLRPFTLWTTAATMPVFNQLNYPVGTVAVDPRAGANTMLVSVHVNRNTTFGIQKTQNSNADPTGGPKTDCPTSPPPPPVGGCFVTPVTGTAAWTSVFGPVATPIVSITFSPSEAGRAYALDQGGAVFVLVNVDDAAATFQPAGSFATIAPDFARQIIADPRTPGRLFAMSHRQVLISTDGNAAVWTQIGQASLPAVQFNSIAMHPTRSNVLYLATSSGVFVSNDAGVNWALVAAGLPNTPVMQVFINATHLYAVTFGRGLWRTRLPS